MTQGCAVSTYQSESRKQNLSALLRDLWAAPRSRAQLADRNGLSRAAVTIMVQELLEQDLVREIDQRVQGVGRPAVLLELNPEAATIIGVEISTGFVAATLTNLVAEPLWQERTVVSGERDGHTLVAQAERLIEAAIARAGESGTGLLGIGVGLPGHVKAAEETLVEATALGLADLPLKRTWETRFSLPVYLENESNAAAMGEWLLGDAGDVSSLLYVSIGGGVGSVVGASLMLNGELWHGAHGLAGAVGHTLLHPKGPLCSCGRLGCWQAVTDLKHEVSKAIERMEAGQESSLKRYAAHGYRDLNHEAIHQAALQGDALALEVVGEMVMAHAQGIANLIATLDPERVVVGGSSIGLTDEARQRVAALQQIPGLNLFDQIRRSSPPAHRERREIRPAAFGADACLMGAVSLVLNAFLENPTVIR
jgi:predicted NBD/HSP70 family sugar kinase